MLKNLKRITICLLVITIMGCCATNSPGNDSNITLNTVVYQEAKRALMLYDFSREDILLMIAKWKEATTIQDIYNSSGPENIFIAQIINLSINDADIARVILSAIIKAGEEHVGQ